MKKALALLCALTLLTGACYAQSMVNKPKALPSAPAQMEKTMTGIVDAVVTADPVKGRKAMIILTDITGKKTAMPVKNGVPVTAVKKGEKVTVACQDIPGGSEITKISAAK